MNTWRSCESFGTQSRAMPRTQNAPRRLAGPRIWATGLWCSLAILGARPGLSAPPIHLDAPRTFVTGVAPKQAIPMNLDGDGDMDVVVLSEPQLNQPQLELFENPGDGSLRPHSTLALTSGNELAAADLNGDGRVDLVQVRSTIGQGELLTLMQSGPFMFTRRTQTLPFGGARVCAGNLDGRNGLDLVLEDDATTPLVWVYLADGAGGFQALGSYATEYAVRDVDGDNRPDAQSPVQIEDVICADLDGDGDDDLVVTNWMERLLGDCPLPHDQCRFQTTDLAVLLNQGGGVFSPPAFLLNAGGKRLRAADMDGDGDRDVVTVTLSQGGSRVNDVVIFPNLGAGQFGQPWRFNPGGGMGLVDGVDLADVDADGDLDVGVMLAGPYSTSIGDRPVDWWALLRNNGRGGLGPPELYPAGADIVDFAWAGLDDSPGPEALCVATNDARVSVHYNEAGRFASPRVFTLDNPEPVLGGYTPTDIGSGDFNADGWADLAVPVDTGGYAGGGRKDALILFDGSPAGVTGTQKRLDLTQGASRVLTGELAGSRADDIAVGLMGASFSNEPMGVSLFLGVNGGLSAPVGTVPLTGLPEDLAALDVDSSGTQDLAVLRMRDEGYTAGVSIVALAANGTMDYLGDILLGSDDLLAWDSRMPNAVATGDVNGDGIKDLVAIAWQYIGPTVGHVTVIRNYGDLSFGLIGDFGPVSREVNDALVVDLTGDGQAEVVLTTPTDLIAGTPDGYVEVFPNLGGGVLGEPVRYNAGTSPTRLTAAAMDDRFGLELIVSCDESNEVTILFNDGQGNFPYRESYYTGGSTDALTVADLDGDGDVDVATANAEDFTDSVYGTISVLANRAIAPNLARADFDGDRDIDQQDLSLLQQCSSGPNIAAAHGPICEAADLDGDDDVDQSDFGLLQRCFTGTGNPNPADPNCAN